MPGSAQSHQNYSKELSEVSLKINAVREYNRRHPEKPFEKSTEKERKKIVKRFTEYLMNNQNKPEKYKLEDLVKIIEEELKVKHVEGKKEEEEPKKKEGQEKKKEEKKEQPPLIEESLSPELSQSQKTLVLKYLTQCLVYLGRLGIVDLNEKLSIEKLLGEISKEDIKVRNEVNRWLKKIIKEGKWPKEIGGAKALQHFVRMNRENLAKAIGNEEDFISKIVRLNDAYVQFCASLNADNISQEPKEYVSNARILLEELEKKVGREGVNYIIEKKYGSTQALQAYFGVKGKDSYETFLNVLNKIENDNGFQRWRADFERKYAESKSLLKNLDLIHQYSFYANLMPAIKESNYVGVMGKWNEEKKGYEYTMDNPMSDAEWIKLFAQHFSQIKLDATKLVLISSFYPEVMRNIEDIAIFKDIMNATAAAEIKIISYYPWEAEKKTIEHFEKNKELVSYTIQHMMKILMNEMYMDRGLKTSASTVYGYGVSNQLNEEDMRILSPTEQWVRNFYISQRGYPSSFVNYVGNTALFPVLTRGELSVTDFEEHHKRPNFGQPFNIKDKTVLHKKKYVPVLPFKIFSSSLSTFILDVESPKFFDKTKFFETSGSLSGRYYDRGEQYTGYGTLNASVMGIGSWNTTITTDFHRYRLDSILNDISNGENWSFDGRVGAVIGEGEEELHAALDLMEKQGLLKGNTLLFFDKTDQGYIVRGYFKDSSGQWYRIQFDAPAEGFKKALIAMSGNSAEVRIMASEEKIVGGLIGITVDNIGVFTAAADNATVLGTLVGNPKNYGYVELYMPPLIKGGEKEIDYGIMAGYFTGQRNKDFLWLGAIGEQRKNKKYYVATFGVKEGDFSFDASIFNLQKYGGKEPGLGGTFGGYLNKKEWEGLIIGTLAKETLGMDNVVVQATYGRGKDIAQTVQLSYYNYAREFISALMESNYANVNIIEELKKYNQKIEERDKTTGDRGRIDAEIGVIKGNIEKYLKRGVSAFSSLAFSQSYYGALYAVNKKGLGSLEIDAIYGDEGSYGINAFVKMDQGFAASLGVFEHSGVDKTVDVKEAQVVVPLSGGMLGVVLTQLNKKSPEGEVNIQSIYAGLKQGSITVVGGYKEGTINTEEFKNAKIELGEAGLMLETEKGHKYYIGFSKQGIVLVDPNIQSKRIKDELYTVHGGVYSLRINEEGRLALTDINFYLGGGKTITSEGKRLKEYVFGTSVYLKKGSDAKGSLDIKYEKVGNSYAIGIGGNWYWIF